MADEKPIYVGGGKEVGNKGIISINLCLSDIPKEHISEFKGKKYIKLSLGALQEPQYYEDKLKRTHWLAVDTWKPDLNYKKRESKNDEPEFSPDDLPF